MHDVELDNLVAYLNTLSSRDITYITSKLKVFRYGAVEEPVYVPRFHNFKPGDRIKVITSADFSWGVMYEGDVHKINEVDVKRLDFASVNRYFVKED